MQVTWNTTVEIEGKRQAGAGGRMDRTALLLDMQMEAKTARLQLGRVRPRRPARPHELLTREKVLQGIAEVKEGRTFCLSPAARLSRRQRAQPAAPPPRSPPTLRDGRPSFNYPLRCDDHDRHDRRGLRRPGAADPAVLDAVGLARACRRPLRRRRRRQARARLLQRLPRGRATSSARRKMPARLGPLRGHAGEGARHREHGRAWRAGPRRADRPRTTTSAAAPQPSATTT